MSNDGTTIAFHEVAQDLRSATVSCQVNRMPAILVREVGVGTAVHKLLAPRNIATWSREVSRV